MPYTVCEMLLSKMSDTINKFHVQRGLLVGYINTIHKICVSH